MTITGGLAELLQCAYRCIIFTSCFLGLAELLQCAYRCIIFTSCFLGLAELLQCAYRCIIFTSCFFVLKVGVNPFSCHFNNPIDLIARNQLNKLFLFWLKKKMTNFTQLAVNNNNNQGAKTVSFTACHSG